MNGFVRLPSDARRLTAAEVRRALPGAATWMDVIRMADSSAQGYDAAGEKVKLQEAKK